LRANEIENLEKESKGHVLRQIGYEDNPISMTFTQNSLNQGIGREYLVQTNISADDNSNEVGGAEIINEEDDDTNYEHDYPIMTS